MSGWQKFTDQVLKTISDTQARTGALCVCVWWVVSDARRAGDAQKHVVYILWGGFAQKKVARAAASTADNHERRRRR